jgi:superfamily II DNA or RNA helicase
MFYFCMRGLYILCSPILDKINASKLGMSLRLQSRIFDYYTYFGKPYYYACYQLPDDHTHTEIYFLEQLILKSTEHLHHPDLASEFRYMSPCTLDSVIKHVLACHNVPYTYHNPIKFDLINDNCNKNKNTNKYTISHNRYLTFPFFKSITLDIHQIDCISSINKVLSRNNKCYIENFCGSGKSIIAFHKLFHYTYSVIVMPTLLLIDQFYFNYIKNSTYTDITTKYKFLCICSTTSSHCTTNVHYINKFINGNQNIVILTTYLSFHLLFNTNKQPNFVVFDEAHKVTDNINTLINKLNKTKILFMSATIPNNHNFGLLAYKFNFNDALSNNICKDFDTIIDVYDDDDKINIYKSIAKHSLTTGNYKILTYHNSVNNSDSDMSVNNFVFDTDIIKKTFFDVLYNDFPNILIKDIIVTSITSTTKNKMDIINSFDNSDPNVIYILASCRTINEGIDVKNCNCICFCEPKFNYIDIIQNIGRASRNINRTVNPKKSTIILPIYPDSDYNSIVHVINSLKNNSSIQFFKNGYCTNFSNDNINNINNNNDNNNNNNNNYNNNVVNHIQTLIYKNTDANNINNNINNNANCNVDDNNINNNANCNVDNNDNSSSVINNIDIVENKIFVVTDDYFHIKNMMDLFNTDIVHFGENFKNNFYQTKSFQYFNKFHCYVSAIDSYFQLQYHNNNISNVSFMYNPHIVYKHIKHDDIVFFKLWNNFNSKQIFNNIIFVPYLVNNIDKYLVNNIDKHSLNVFTGYKFYDNNYTINYDNVACFIDHIKYICNYQDELVEYVINWLAHVIQFPTIKMNTAIVFYHQLTDTIDTAFIDILNKLFYNYIHQMSYFGTFNNFTFPKIITIRNILKYTKINTLTVEINELKNIITQKTARIEFKGKDPVLLDDYRHYIFATNNELIFKVSESDRRYCLVECPEVKKNTHYFDNLYSFIDNDDYITNFFMFLATKDLSNFSCRNIPLTNYKLRNIINSMPAFVQMLRSNYHDFSEQQFFARDLFNRSISFAKNNRLSSCYSFQFFSKQFKKYFSPFYARDNSNRFYRFPEFPCNVSVTKNNVPIERKFKDIDDFLLFSLS